MLQISKLLRKSSKKSLNPWKISKKRQKFQSRDKIPEGESTDQHHQAL